MTIGDSSDTRTASSDRVELYWIPLGAGVSAGAHVVRVSGALYESLMGLVQRRPARPLFHSALVVHAPEGRYVIEVTPVPREGTSGERGVVGGGAVGSSILGRLRIFRYEIRLWLDGGIPDIGYAVESPVIVSNSADDVSNVVHLLPEVPTAVWGRDELRAGEMWNSNSVVSWALARTGLIERAGHPPSGGRAPGWNAGAAVARRSTSA